MSVRSKLVPLNEPRSVRVRTDDRGVPLAVASSGHGAPARPGRARDGRLLRVEAVRETWRIDDEWWRRPVSRVYWNLVLEGGALVCVYRDMADGRWYLHG